MKDPNALRPKLEELRKGKPKSIWNTNISDVPRTGKLKLNAFFYRFRKKITPFNWSAYDNLDYLIKQFGIDKHIPSTVSVPPISESKIKEFLQSPFNKAYKELLSNIEITEISREVLRNDQDYSKMLEPYFSNLCSYYAFISNLLTDNPKHLTDFPIDEIPEQATTNSIINTTHNYQKEKEQQEKVIVALQSASRLIEEGDKSYFSLEEKLYYYKLAETVLGKALALAGQTYAITTLAHKLKVRAEAILAINKEKRYLHLRECLVNIWDNERYEEAENMLKILEYSLLEETEKKKLDVVRALFERQTIHTIAPEVKDIITNFLNELRGGPLFSQLEQRYGDQFDQNKHTYEKFLHDLKNGYLDFLLIGYEAFQRYGFGAGTYLEQMENERFEETMMISSRFELGFTGDLKKFKQFIHPDPELMFFKVAQGEQPYQRYLSPLKNDPEPQSIHSTTEYWQMDISSSMSGKRAEVRDALFCVRLNRHVKEAKQQQFFSPFYYQLFNDGLRKLCCIKSQEEATNIIDHFSKYHEASGGTSITNALLSAFSNIRTCDQKNKDLSKATVVVVTDGEDSIDAKSIRKVRKGIREEVEIVLHFISIFEGNEDLKKIVLEQNTEGERGFYFHINEKDLENLGQKIKSEIKVIEMNESSQKKVIPHKQFQEGMQKMLAIYDQIYTKHEENKSTLRFRELMFPTYFPLMEDPLETSTNSTKNDSNELTIERKIELILSVITSLCSVFQTASYMNDCVLLLEHLLDEQKISKETYVTVVLQNNNKYISTLLHEIQDKKSGY